MLNVDRQVVGRNRGNENIDKIIFTSFKLFKLRFYELIEYCMLLIIFE